jgi:hypothetical protein
MRVFFIGLFLGLLLQGCTQKYKLTNGQKISEKHILSEVFTLELNSPRTSFYKGENVNIQKETIKFEERNKIKFDQINQLEPRKLLMDYDPNNKPFFYYKISNGELTYHKVDQTNIFKPHETNQPLFTKEVNRIIELLETEKLAMKDIQTVLNLDYGIKAKYQGISDWMEEKAFLPQVLKTLEKDKKGKVFKSDTQKLSHLSYLSLVQNIGETKKVATLTYYKITLH